MKKYRIIVTPDAEEDLNKYIVYLIEKKKNPQAVRNLLKDFRETKNCLSNVAGSLKDPENEKMIERGLKRINFLHHNYFMLYYIDKEIAYITQIFHGLENFEDKLR